MRFGHGGGRPPDRDLADELTRFFSTNDKEDVIARAKHAYEIYCKHIVGRKFNTELEDLLISFRGGSRSSWTKWHRAGEAVVRVERLGQGDKLPHSLRALYQISFLGDVELRLCLQGPAPVIHPRATAKSIQLRIGRLTIRGDEAAEAK
jgi:hypothetical protein